MPDQRPRRDLLEEALAGEPDSIDIRLALAALHMEDRNPAGAIALYGAILEMDPSNAEAFNGLGLCWGMALLENIPTAELWGREIDEEEMLEKALAFLERAVELDPEKVSGYNALGRLYVIGGQEEEAMEMFQQSLLIDPAQLDVLEEIQEITGCPVWELLEKDTDTEEFEE